MKTIDEWDGMLWVAGNSSKLITHQCDDVRGIIEAIRAEAFEAAMGAIDTCAFRGKDHKLRSTITFIDAIRVIRQLGEEKP